jgi:hypothetical protein
MDLASETDNWKADYIVWLEDYMFIRLAFLENSFVYYV